MRETPAASSLAFTTGETIVRRDNQVLNSWRQPAARRYISGAAELARQGSAGRYTHASIHFFFFFYGNTYFNRHLINTDRE